MAENAHHQQLGKFVVLFQGLESALVEMFGVTAGEDYAAAILPAETRYRRLVGSTDLTFSHFVDQLRQPALETKARFHELMERCLDIGVLRNRLVHSKYALLISAGHVAAPVRGKAEPKFKGGSRRQVIGEALSAESFEPYFQKIAEALAELESFKLRVVEWKHPNG